MTGKGKAQVYENLAREVKSYLEDDFVANLANTAAILYHGLEQINWLGFYLLKGDTLVLGPFQGRAACVKIPVGKGVCGTAVARKQVLRVNDVDKFEGHIVCDSRSKSEIVIPLYDSKKQVLGVLDVDAPIQARFDEEDEKGLLMIMELLLNAHK